MINDTTPSIVPAAENLTPVLVKSKLEKALISIESGIQTLNTKESQLVYNSDNLQEIADFVDTVKKARKKVEAERVSLKSPYKVGGDTVDAGAKLVDTELSNLLKKAGDKYDAMVREQNRLQKIQDDETKRGKGIKDTIDNTIMTFSTKIAEAKDLTTLLDLERRLNLETANEKRYQEQLPDLKSRCEAIRSLLSLQKQNVREMAEIDGKAANALKTGQDLELEALTYQKEEIEAKVEETSTIIQETAINQSTSTHSAPAVQVFITTKAKRTTTEWEVTDILLLYKTWPKMVKLIPDEEAIKEYVKRRKAEITDDNPEIKIAGLRIYQKKSFI